ncbi:MBL fold metallo-hydrolase [Planctomonas psychrotolerans]|uniref:MBL fold metallo-hydrolase n=1 Tax=Planctomonas psychrotolerans TaxID=2528712 RepID=UPI00123A5E4A|nr:MBL fold metallo-hydrolase [Planctomonas psychrotolerans]
MTALRADAGAVEEVAPGIFRVRDTCNVYVLVADPDADGRRTAITIDFGSGMVLDLLDELGIDRVTDVLMTHHHRDQGQGLPRAVDEGIAIHVPPVEVDLFAKVNDMWATRPLDNDYNVRQDRFSLLDAVPVTSTVREYRTTDYGGIPIRVLPTPGHTVGSVTYVVQRNGGALAFSGDLIYAPGKVWSLASTQWSYTNSEGPAMTVISCLLLQREHLDLLLPSHGDPMSAPDDALGLLAERMQTLVDSQRWYAWDLRDRLAHPYTRITEHLLINRSSMSTGYVLLSNTGEALFIDFGYDMTTGLPTGSDRAARRPWLASLPALREQFGVTRISAALATHYHDDHVAGLPILREVEGTEVWTPANVAPILDDPLQHDLPCQWYEPIRSDRVLPLGEAVQWNEYSITVHELPGHTLFAAAFEVVVDGVRVLFTGDQQEGLGVRGDRREILNYQYRNRFRIDDYRHSARLYKRVAPGLLASGHWDARWVDEGYLDYLDYAGEDLIEMHHALLPLDELDLGADSVLARLSPYRCTSPAGSTVRYTVTVRNPHAGAALARIVPVVPAGWRAEPTVLERMLTPGEEAALSYDVLVGGAFSRRERLAVDVTIGSLRLGQHAEALLTVGTVSLPSPAPRA